MKAVTLFLLLRCICLSGLVRSQTDTVITYYDNKSPKEIYETDNLIKDGLYQFFYESGNLWQIGEYNKGALTGEWRVYNKNGVLIQVSNYVKNKLSGKQSYYYSDSSIKQLLFYKAGRLDGIAQLYANQNILSEGYLSEEISYEDGAKNGIYIKYNEKGDSVIVGKFKSNLKSHFYCSLIVNTFYFVCVFPSVFFIKNFEITRIYLIIVYMIYFLAFIIIKRISDETYSKSSKV